MTGPELFARYAYPPNKLGYCGPADGLDGPLDDAGLRGLARQFHGAWPYLVVLAELAGVPDPLDPAVVEAYWLGGGLGAEIDAVSFGTALLARIGPRAGRYWQHLTADLLPEAAPNHCFHVFGVYPWSRLLAAGPPEPPLHVLGNCRIRPGEIVSVSGAHAVVRTRPLEFAGELTLGGWTEETFTVATGSLSPAPGQWVALHWQWVTDVLTPDQVIRLDRTTETQLELTNRRVTAAVS